MKTNSLHITAAAAPNVEIGNPRLLVNDLKLAKASVLYADKTTLCSGTAWMAASIFTLGVANLGDIHNIEMMAYFYRTLGPVLDPKASELMPLFEKHIKLVKRNPLTLSRRERKIKSEFKKTVLQIWAHLQGEFVRITRGFGFDEIELAITAGVLELHPFTEHLNENFVNQYFDAVKDALSSSVTHPMLDESTSELVRAAVRAGKLLVSDRSGRKSKQTGLVANLFERLPVFDVPMDELLDLRKELDRPLISFRAKVIDLANDIEAAKWDADFESDVQEVYLKSVAPVLLEIEEELKSQRFRDFWVRRIADKAGALGIGGTIAATIGAAIAPWAGIIAGFAGAAAFAEAGATEWFRERSAIERNGLYFYYRLKEAK